jgi:hypothetical protein
MPRKKPRKVKVVYRPLGKEQAWGQAWPTLSTPLIEIDPRLSPCRELEVLCHEALHVALPHLTNHPPKSKDYRKGEAEIDRIGKVVSRVLWSQNFRRVSQGKHTTPVRISR